MITIETGTLLFDLSLISIEAEPRQKGHIGMNANGRPMMFVPNKTKKFQELVTCEAMKIVKGSRPYDGALVLHVHIFKTPPKSWSNKKKLAACVDKIRPSTRPDADNYLGSILDALNGIVYWDDARLVSIIVEKYYRETPAIHIRLYDSGTKGAH